MTIDTLPRDQIGRFAPHANSPAEVSLNTETVQDVVERSFPIRQRTVDGVVHISHTVRVGVRENLTLYAHEDTSGLRIVADIESDGEHLHIDDARFHEPALQELVRDVQTEDGCTAQNVSDLTRRIDQL